MNDYQQALQVMNDLFQKDYQFALATSQHNQPSVRFIDTYYQDKELFIVTYLTSRKVKEILANPNVALTNRLYKFFGKGVLLGHPSEEKNQAIRETLIKVFEPWYFAHNDESNPNMCYVKIVLEQGFIYKDGKGYNIDFLSQKVETFPYDFDIEPMS